MLRFEIRSDNQACCHRKAGSRNYSYWANTYMMLLEDFFVFLESLAETIPVELYALIGGLIEEVIVPIPSPIIMTTAGGIVKLQGGTWVNILIISLLAAFGKTVGSLILYVIADKMEDFFVIRFGKYLGIEQKTIEDLGERFKGGWKDFGVLTALRAIPVIPGAPVALACGAIKLNMRTYISSTMVGTFLRSLFFAYIGFVGAESYANLMGDLDTIESIMNVLVIILIFLGIWYVKRLSEQRAQFR